MRQPCAHLSPFVEHLRQRGLNPVEVESWGQVQLELYFDTELDLDRLVAAVPVRLPVKVSSYVDYHYKSVKMLRCREHWHVLSWPLKPSSGQHRR